jgi:hypothetical protein
MYLMANAVARPGKHHTEFLRRTLKLTSSKAWAF